MWLFLQVRNYFLSKINNKIKMFKLIGQVVLWGLYKLDAAELSQGCKRSTLIQPIQWMDLTFWPMWLTYYTNFFFFTEFTIRTFLDNSKMNETKGKALEFSKPGSGGETTYEKFPAFCLFDPPTFSHAFPQLGLPDNIQDIQWISMKYVLNNARDIFILKIICWLSELKFN